MENFKRLHTPKTIRLEPDQAEALKRLARREKRSVSNVIRVLLSEALATRQGKPKAHEAAA